MIDAYRTDTRLGVYLSRTNHFTPNRIVAFSNTQLLEAYADASGKDSTSTERLLTVCGCISTTEKWQEFDDKWQPYLKGEGFKPVETQEGDKYVFHTTDFWADTCKHMPKGLIRSDKQRIYNHLIDLARDYSLHRFGFAILIKDFWQLEVEFPHIREGYFQEPGTFVSKTCFQSNADWALNHNHNLAINYMFDRGDEFWGQMYDEYRKVRRRVPHNERIVADLIEGDKVDHSPLQAADILAWEARTYFLSCRPGHIAGLITLPRPRPELERLKGNSTYLLMQGRKELLARMRDFYKKQGASVGLVDSMVGPGREFKTIDDLILRHLEFQHTEKANKRQANLDAWFAQKQLKREARENAQNANK